MNSVWMMWDARSSWTLSTSLFVNQMRVVIPCRSATLPCSQFFMLTSNEMSAKIIHSRDMKSIFMQNGHNLSGKTEKKEMLPLMIREWYSANMLQTRNDEKKGLQLKKHAVKRSNTLLQGHTKDNRNRFFCVCKRLNHSMINSLSVSSFFSLFFFFFFFLYFIL